MCATCSAQGSGCWEGDAQVRRDLVATPRSVAFRTAGKVLWRFQLGFGVFGVSSLQGVREKQGKHREIAA
ncbi:hypothetical protein Taro_005225 [Colocasia esculenta]|uniref:Uncharacterized protein n=1 Tax=Colocasia esculenta TaxID=4460 RepID=A0A843TKB6_COLES|nr:hypothetical protein [Colocasia esculenta]